MRYMRLYVCGLAAPVAGARMHSAASFVVRSCDFVVMEYYMAEHNTMLVHTKEPLRAQT